ncbi:MAG: ScpA family protein [Maricaulaceae bacterium]
MSDNDFQDDLNFEAADNAADDGLGLILDIDGYEGPLHLLLELARGQKVDLTRISILELAEQYINFIKSAKDLRIELAADYLVMASWLAYLKSRMILPREDGEAPEVEPAEMAAHLAFRLQRLEAMRRAAQALFRLPLAGETVFARGNPEGLRSKSSPLYEAEMYDLLKAYGESRSKATFRNHKLPKPLVLTLSDARDRLRRAIKASGITTDNWTSLGGLLPQSSGAEGEVPQESIKASSLLAGLEMAKDGEIFLRQDEAFSEIYLRASGQESRRKDIENSG